MWDEDFSQIINKELTDHIKKAFGMIRLMIVQSSLHDKFLKEAGNSNFMIQDHYLSQRTGMPAIMRWLFG